MTVRELMAELGKANPDGVVMVRAVSRLHNDDPSCRHLGLCKTGLFYSAPEWGYVGENGSLRAAVPCVELVPVGAGK